MMVATAAVARKDLEARLEWWRRTALQLAGVIVLGIAGWFATLQFQVMENRQSISSLQETLADLVPAVQANTAALASVSQGLQEIDRLMRAPGPQR